MGLEMALKAAITQETAAVLLGAEHVDELPAPRDQVPQRPGLVIGQGPGNGANGFGKQRDHPSVQRVGLGQLPSGPREVTDLPGIDHGDGQPRPGQRGGDRDLVAAGRFQDDNGGRERPRTRAMSVTNPASSWPTRKDSPVGSTWTSRWAFETSIPTKQGCSMTRPCTCGLGRPKRLFGFDDGTVGGAPSSRTVFRDPEGDGLPPTFTHPSVVLGCFSEIQEGGVMVCSGTDLGAGCHPRLPRRVRVEGPWRKIGDDLKYLSDERWDGMMASGDRAVRGPSV